MDPHSGDSLPQGSAGHPYQIVLDKGNGNLLKINPETAKGLLRIVDDDPMGTAQLSWGNSINRLNFVGDEKHENTNEGLFKPFKVANTGIFSINNGTRQWFDTFGKEGSFQGVVDINKENHDIALRNFDWRIGGYSIPIFGGKYQSGIWTMTTYPNNPVQTKINSNGIVNVNYISFFNSSKLYAEDMVSNHKMPIAFNTLVVGSFTPNSSQLPSYITSQISLQTFAWLIPIAVLMAILSIDYEYGNRINRKYSELNKKSSENR